MHWTDAKRCTSCGEMHCYWCGVPLARGRTPIARTPWRAATREHLTPRAHGGGGNANIVAACRGCNEARGIAMDWVPFHAQGQRPSGQRLRIAIASGREVRYDQRHGWMVTGYVETKDGWVPRQ